MTFHLISGPPPPPALCGVLVPLLLTWQRGEKHPYSAGPLCPLLSHVDHRKLFLLPPVSQPGRWWLYHFRPLWLQQHPASAGFRAHTPLWTPALFSGAPLLGRWESWEQRQYQVQVYSTLSSSQWTSSLSTSRAPEIGHLPWSIHSGGIIQIKSALDEETPRYLLEDAFSHLVVDKDTQNSVYKPIFGFHRITSSNKSTLILKLQFYAEFSVTVFIFIWNPRPYLMFSHGNNLSPLTAQRKTTFSWISDSSFTLLFFLPSLWIFTNFVANPIEYIIHHDNFHYFMRIMHYNNSNSMLYLLSATNSAANIQWMLATVIIIVEQLTCIIFLTAACNVVNITIFFTL